MHRRAGRHFVIRGRIDEVENNVKGTNIM
jgi:hypothetical protein